MQGVFSIKILFLVVTEKIYVAPILFPLFDSYHEYHYAKSTKQQLRTDNFQQMQRHEA